MDPYRSNEPRGEDPKEPRRRDDAVVARAEVMLCVIGLLAYLVAAVASCLGVGR